MVDATFEKIQKVMDLNKTLKDALEQATQSLLNVSAATQEQIALVVEFTKETQQDVTLQGGIVIPNALKLVESLREDIQTLKAEQTQDYKEKFLEFLQEKETQVQEEMQKEKQRVEAQKQAMQNNFNTLLSALNAQKDAQANDYKEIKKEYAQIKAEVEEKLRLINTDAFLREFAELKVELEASKQKVNRLLANHSLATLEHNISLTLMLQKLLNLTQGERNG
ncbi:hypothetical protein [Helicobacter sp.]|uniref:hypothetical protein n=1 Tax=Helicobacter sp. TaxID=218 RepID=UPI002A75F865|nr:hypothetical protein [Helicobacter sp.]MDY2584086.1 hypothetical protein [Helicobacter sp.]